MENPSDGSSSQNHVFEHSHDLMVVEQQATILLGGKQVAYKRFIVEKSPEMQTYLNQQSLIKVAGSMVSQTVIDETLSGISSIMGSAMNSGGGKKIIGKIAKALMSTVVAPDPVKVFGGVCDPLIDKKVCSGAVMARVQKELPSVIPSLFMGDFFGSDDDSSVATKAEGATGRLM